MAHFAQKPIAPLVLPRLLPRGPQFLLGLIGRVLGRQHLRNLLKVFGDLSLRQSNLAGNFRLSKPRQLRRCYIVELVVACLNVRLRTDRFFMGSQRLSGNPACPGCPF